MRSAGLTLPLVAALLAATFARDVHAEPYHDIGRPEQCGTYEETDYDHDSFFPGGEGGLIALTQAEGVRGLNAALFDGIMTEEGFSDPVGRVLALRGKLASVQGTSEDEVLILTIGDRIRILQPCR